MKGFKAIKYGLLCGLLLACSCPAFAQILSATIGVNGLTCSQCSRSVEMSLRRLPFVQKVDMNLAHTQGTVYFKQGKPINLEALAQAPRDAGFSTRFVRIRLDLSAIHPGERCFVYQGKAFYFLQPLQKQQRSAIMGFQIIAKGFLTDKEWRTYTFKPDSLCSASEKYYLKPLSD